MSAKTLVSDIPAIREQKRLFTFGIIFLILVQFCFAAHSPRVTLLVSLDQEPSWRDMAFLAAAPAAKKANRNGGSLLVVGATDPVRPEVLDYLKRYRPQAIYSLGAAQSAKNLRLDAIPFEFSRPTSAQEAGLHLSRRFWKTSKTAVVCHDEDYESALLGASVAGLLDAPLLFVTRSGALPGPVTRELERLGADRLIAMGIEARGFKGKVIPLSGPEQTMAWVKKSGFKVSYLAAVNPLDRTMFTTRKLSLVGAQLAVGRGGLVAPLRYKVQWKLPFESTIHVGATPKGVPPSDAPAKSGVLEMDGSSFPFVLTGLPEERELRLSIDLGNGRYTAPLSSGDEVDLAGKRWVVSLGTRTRFGKTDVHLTWPTSNELRAKLNRYYLALGGPPRHLCLVGFPDTLPHAIIGKGGVVEEQVSDLPYAFIEDEGFARIAVGRVIAEDAGYGALYAARVLTYNDLLSPEWQRTASQAEWENGFGPLFQNVGFLEPYHMAAEEVPWKVAPKDGSPGTREPSFAPNSPLARSAVLAHSEHSWWLGMGATLTFEATVPLAPTLIESGGCGVACLDREPDHRSVVARVLRLGAVGFTGGTRELSAESAPIRMEFWSRALIGDTIGEAHRKALNVGIWVSRDRAAGLGCAYRYATQVHVLIGDPALAIRTPSPPRHEPARTVIEGDLVSVFAPERWSVVKKIVPPDWKEWVGKDLFAVRGHGALSMTSWCGEGRDDEIVLVVAEFITPQKPTALIPVQQPSEPMGWNGKWISTPNPDGTFTTRLGVRMIDFDQLTGIIRAKVDVMQFKIKY